MKTMKTKILLIALACLSTVACGQNKSKQTNTGMKPEPTPTSTSAPDLEPAPTSGPAPVPEVSQRYEIARYEIAPDEQLVYGQQMTGGISYDSDGNAIHWDGYKYIPVKEIDFKTTSLIFAGNKIAFKEFFPVKTADLSSLKVIHHTIGYDNSTTILSPTEKKLYTMWSNGAVSETNIDGYTHVTGPVFKTRQGKLYYLPAGNEFLTEIGLPLDASTLQHVTLNYYADKNGLYFLDPYNQHSQQLEAGHGLKPLLYDRYFTYGDAAYPYCGNREPKEIRINATRLNRLDTPYTSYLGDGQKLFELPYSTSTDVRDMVSPKNIVQIGTPAAPFNEWHYFDIITVGGNLKGKTLYYSTRKIYAGSGSPHALIKTPEGFYGLTGSSMELEARKLDNVMIYHLGTQQYEPIELDKFRRLTTNFYIYKKQMYYSNSHPFATDIKVEELAPISLYGQPTQFYTDGNVLLGGYNLGDLKTEEKDGHLWYSFAREPFRDVDWGTLQVVNEETLVDKNNIYLINSSILQIIPIKNLRLNVKVLDVLK